MVWGFVLHKILQQMLSAVKQSKKIPLLRKNFDFDRKTDPNVQSVRRRVRFASLWGFFDLCQSAEKYVFDRLKTARLGGFAFCGKHLNGCLPLLDYPFSYWVRICI